MGKGRVYIQFTGTVGDVEKVRWEIHHYLAEGKIHLANDRDPQIPAALSPVVTGVASLHDFFPKHFSHPGNFVKRDLKTGKYTVLPPDPAEGSAMGPKPLAPSGLQQANQVHTARNPRPAEYSRSWVATFDDRISTMFLAIPADGTVSRSSAPCGRPR